MDDAAELLPPALRAELDALRRRLRPKSASGALGETRGLHRGGRTDFESHRAYVPGDDPRGIDWAAMARSGETVVKEFRAEEDVVVRLVVDASASLDDGPPSKFRHAQQLAAALGYLSLAGGQRVQPWIAAESPRGPLLGQSLRGRAATGRLVAALQSVVPSGAARLADFVGALLSTAARPGLLVLISDFLEVPPLLTALDRARQEHHDVMLVQVLSEEELTPTLQGDLLLVDPESGEGVEVSIDQRALDEYQAQLRGLMDSLATWCKRRGATYVLSPSAEPIATSIRRLLGEERAA